MGLLFWPRSQKIFTELIIIVKKGGGGALGRWPPGEGTMEALHEASVQRAGQDGKVDLPALLISRGK